MIVKNEAHVILTTLTTIIAKVPITSWVISDTGSTDATIDVIKDFFKSNNIPGVLVQHQWVDFAHNRTKVLECAFNTSDYIMLFDADDTIIGNVPPLKPGHDRYNAKFGEHVSYTRPLFINNRKKWHYTGVLHEYLDSHEPRTATLMNGDFHIISGRTGARNANPMKYQDDANILVQAFNSESNQTLKSRYAFYCAQSFRDAKMVDSAIEWYLIRLSLKGWKQELYCSCMQLGYLYRSKHDHLNQFNFFSKASEFDSSRIEGVVEAMRLMYTLQNHMVVNSMYHRWKDYTSRPPNALFVNKHLYEYQIEYLNSISAFYVDDQASGYLCCKHIIKHCSDNQKVTQTIKNIQLYNQFKNDYNFSKLIKSHP
jgi:glycosyltransferase involved in cell wall biosynthesis